MELVYVWIVGAGLLIGIAAGLFWQSMDDDQKAALFIGALLWPFSIPLVSAFLFGLMLVAAGKQIRQAWKARRAGKRA